MSKRDAARELQQLEALCLTLRSRRRECLEQMSRVERAEQTEYVLTEPDVERFRLFDTQWTVYAYANTLHALWELVRDASVYVDGKYSLITTEPELLAIRNCMQHAGPIEINYDRNRQRVVVTAGHLRSAGDWGGANRPFGDYFSSPNRVVYLERVVRDSDSTYNDIAEQFERKQFARYGESALKSVADSLSLYE